MARQHSLGEEFTQSDVSYSDENDVFEPFQIGCKVENLWNVGVSDGNPYENSLCRITREPLIRKQQRKPYRQRKSDGQ